MPNRHVPGCRCCRPSCLLYAERFDGPGLPEDWIEESGDWSIIDGALTTSDTSASILFDADTGVVPFFGSRDFRIKIKASSGTIIVLEDTLAGSQSYLKLTVGAGSKVQLYTTACGGTLLRECSVSIPADEWFEVNLYCDEYLSINGIPAFFAAWYGSDGCRITTKATLFNRFKVESGTGDVFFDDFEIHTRYQAEEHEDCPECPTCRWLPDGIRRPSVAFSIVGATDYSSSPTIYMSRLNGNYEAIPNPDVPCGYKIDGLDIVIIEAGDGGASEQRITQAFVDLQNVVFRDALDLSGYSYELLSPAVNDYCETAEFNLEPTNGGTLTMDLT
jgi:hypothetical protein